MGGGGQTYSFTGRLNVFPLEVYNDGSSIANILSLCKNFRVTVDSDTEHAITIHLTDIHPMKFTRCNSGL